MTFEEMYEQNFRCVYNAVYMRVLHRETAEDITGETFVKAFQSFDSYDAGRAKPATWLLAIAGNEVKMYFRKASTTREIATDELPEGSSGEDEEERVRLLAINREAERILSALTETERELISLRIGAQLSFQEMGTLLDTTARGAEERYRRVIARCRKITAGKKIEDLV